ncbi:MAG: 4Fe-4S binding protein, partial [Dethiobacteria bacterium]
AIGFTKRGINRVVTTFKDLPLAESICTQCMLCVEACPVGALYYKKNKSDDSNKNSEKNKVKNNKN